MKKSLLEIIEERKLLSPEQIQSVKYEATQAGKTYEVVISEKNLLDEKTLAELKAEAYGMEFVDLKGITIPSSVVSMVDSESLKRYVAVPIEDMGTVVKVAMANPVDLQAIQALRTILGKDIKVVIALKDDIFATIEKQSGETISTEVSAALEDVEGSVTKLEDTVQDISKITGELAKAPVARIINTLLQLAVKLNASDIHIEPEEDRVRVRLRINGVLQEKMTLPTNLKASLISRIKILSKLKIDEKRIPQDGRFAISFGDRKVDLRVSTVPTLYGEKVVLRLLERSGGASPLETTGIRGSTYKIFTESISKTTGIVLVTGPTGSGKTRTLAGSLIRLNKPGVNIITLEDPIEIRIKGVNQIQVNPEIDLTFANGLRSILRQDPNIIMVGEIRDSETARLAVQAALTGHLVLSTLHTNNAAGALPRLLDMGIEPYLIASTVQCVAAQRLVRTICPYCKESYLASFEVVSEIKTVLNWKNFSITNYLNEQAKLAQENAAISNSAKSDQNQTPAPPQNQTSGTDEQIYLYRGKGCEKCDGNGYAGRTGIFEAMRVSERISKLIMEHKTSGELQIAAVEEGMITMMQDGYLKVLEGLTTIEEVLRVVKE